jgi:hypothetical protein
MKITKILPPRYDVDKYPAQIMILVGWSNNVL